MSSSRQVRLSKITTKCGDAGQTQLATGVTVSKGGSRIEAHGHVDELNCVTGDLVVTAHTHQFEPVHMKGLERIQQELFDLGGELSFPADDGIAQYSQSYLRTEAIERLETEMDEMLSHLSPLSNFVLPGGHILNTKAHICRAVCRRAERAMVDLHATEPLRAEVLAYINRLSDWFFVFSRAVCRHYQVQEILWDQSRYPHPPSKES